jgi:hypothetical protein
MTSVRHSFQYDPFGRRVSKTIGGSTQYLYDGANPVQELSGSSASANLLAGGVDEYFQRTDSAGARHFLTDALGSTLALADSTGALQPSTPSSLSATLPQPEQPPPTSSLSPAANSTPPASTSSAPDTTTLPSKGSSPKIRSGSEEEMQISTRTSGIVRWITTTQVERIQ